MMESCLYEKSKDSFKSADLLIKNTLNAPSIHCAYYSCVQLMFHILRVHFSMSEADIEKEQKETSKQLEGGTHAWLINSFTTKLIECSNWGTVRDFSSNIGQLKGVRVLADYKNCHIESKKAIQAFKTSERVLSTLKKHFKV